MPKKPISAHKTHSPDFKTVRIRTETNGAGALKTLFVIALLCMQIAVVFGLYFWFIAAFRWYLPVSFACSLAACVHVLSAEKNGQSKAVWILFLLLGFSFGYAVYFLSDARVFFRRAKRRYSRIYENTRQYAVGGRPANAAPAVVNDCAYLRNAGGFSAYTHTDVTYFSSGTQLFDDMLARLQAAESFIFMEYFIIADGILLQRLTDILERKAEGGVDVRVLYDGMGSHGTFSRKAKARMKRAGIRLYPFSRLVPRLDMALNYRDHRKIVVVDGETAYTGGSNLADEYINEKRMYGYWKDTGIRIDGRAADGFTLMFLRQWEFVVKETPAYETFLNRTADRAGTSVVVPYAGGLDYDYPVAKTVYANIIAGAQRKLYSMTPYFIPDETIGTALADKALSGVDVRIVLPGVPDKAAVYSVTRSNAERLAAAGVKIYYMKNSFVHSKLMLSENCVAVGSVNMDLRSFYQQFESAVYTDDPAAMAAVEKDFEQTFADCEPFSGEKRKGRNPFRRIAAGILRLLAPLM